MNKVDFDYMAMREKGVKSTNNVLLCMYMVFLFIY